MAMVEMPIILCAHHILLISKIPPHNEWQSFIITINIIVEPTEIRHFAQNYKLC